MKTSAKYFDLVDGP